MNKLLNKSVIPLSTIIIVLIAHMRKLAVSTALLFFVVLECQAANVFFHQYERPINNNGHGKYIQIAMIPTGDIYIMDIGLQRVESVDENRNNDTPIVDPYSPSGNPYTHLSPASSPNIQPERLQPVQQQLIQLGVSDSDGRIVTSLHNALTRTYYASHSTPGNSTACESGIIAIESLVNWIEQLRRTELSADDLNTVLNQFSGLGLTVLVPELVATQQVPPFATLQSIAVNNQGTLQFTLQVTIFIQREGREEPLTTTLTLRRNQNISIVSIPALPNHPGQDIRFNSLPIIGQPAPLSPILADNIQGTPATDNSAETYPAAVTPEVDERALLEQLQAWFLVYRSDHPINQIISNHLNKATSNLSKDSDEKVRRQILGYWDKHKKKISEEDATPFKALKKLHDTKERKKDAARRSQNQSTPKKTTQKGGYHSVASDVAGSLTRSPEVGSRPAMLLSSGSLNNRGIDLSVLEEAFVRAYLPRRSNHPDQRQNNRRDRGIQWHNPSPQNLPLATNPAVASNDAGGGQIYGCEHYRRNCEVRVEGCNEFYACHRCHEEECQVEGCKGKKLSAKNVEAIKCGECGYEQDLSISEPQQNCPGCNLQLAEYMCKKCKHFVSNNIDPFHCDKCNKCRDHKSRSFHCDGCGVCLDINSKGNHECRGDSGNDECCICLDSVFSGCQALPCTHKIHKKCLDKLRKQGGVRCPLCKKTFGGRPHRGSGNRQ